MSDLWIILFDRKLNFLPKDFHISVLVAIPTFYLKNIPEREGHKWSPLGSVLGLVLFNIFTSDTDSGIEWTFSTSLLVTPAVDMIEEKNAIQKDLDRLEKWAHMYLMRYKAKYKALRLGQGNPRYLYWENSLRASLGVPIDMNKLYPGLHPKKGG